MSLPLRKAGFLTKKCRHRRGWERRYFVLTHSSLHRYIRRPEDELFGTLRDTLPLTSIAAVERCDAQGLSSLARGVGYQSCHFAIRLKRGPHSADGSPASGRESSSPRRRRGQETLILRASSTEERDEWLIQLDGLLDHAFNPSAPRLRDRTSISGNYPAAEAAAAALRGTASLRKVDTRLHLVAVDAPPAPLRSTLAVARVQRAAALAAAAKAAAPLPAALLAPPPSLLVQLFGGAPSKREPSPAEVAASRLRAATEAIAGEDPLAPALRFAGTFEDSIEARRGGGAESAGDSADRLWDSAAGTEGVGAEARRALLLFTELGGSVVVADDGSVGSGSSGARVALRANDIVLPIVGGDAPEWDTLAVAALCAAKHAHGAAEPLATSWADLGTASSAAGDATIFPLQLDGRGAATGAAGGLPTEAFTWQPARFGARRRVVYVCFSTSIFAEALKRLVGESEDEDAGDDVALAARCKCCAFVVQHDLAPVTTKAAVEIGRAGAGGASANAATKTSAEAMAPA